MSHGWHVGWVARCCPDEWLRLGGLVMGGLRVDAGSFEATSISCLDLSAFLCVGAEVGKGSPVLIGTQCGAVSMGLLAKVAAW